ncbi:hypothetical protein KCP78_11655 [Salmonella enterica subsp. enterica]|nr:hypothetical protein KCP78_11655 [Salmonella enterica subsp. enterica]
MALSSENSGWLDKRSERRCRIAKLAFLVAREFGGKVTLAEMKWATYIPWHPDTNDGWLIHGASVETITLWMPLPEPAAGGKK